jgi:hypothetical protein
MPRAARAGVDPGARLNFLSHNNMRNLLPTPQRHADGKGGIRAIGRNNSSQTCGRDLARPEFGAATLSECGRVRPGGVICSRAAVLF